MPEFLKILNEHLGKYQPLINAILAIGTITYVVITFFILLSQKRLNAQNILPKLVIDSTLKYYTTGDGGIFYTLPIRNIGRGPAFNLGMISNERGIKITDIKEYIRPDEEFKMLINFTIKYKGKMTDKDGNPFPKVNLYINYQDLSGKRYGFNYVSTKYDPGIIKGGA